MSSLLKNKRIFIIEDNVENKTIMQLLLEQAGAKVWIERWGKEYLKRLQSVAPVDLILLDLMLPGGVSGFDVFDHIHATPEFCDVPVVAVSASNPDTAIPQAKARGLQGFIEKPLDYDLFVRIVAQAIANPKEWHQS